MDIHAVDSANTPSGQGFISEVDRIITLEGAGETSKRVAFDCEGVNLCSLGTLKIVYFVFHHWMSTD